jgi:hypothetical protein
MLRTPLWNWINFPQVQVDLFHDDGSPDHVITFTPQFEDLMRDRAALLIAIDAQVLARQDHRSAQDRATELTQQAVMGELDIEHSADILEGGPFRLVPAKWPSLPAAERKAAMPTLRDMDARVAASLQSLEAAG